MNRWKVHSTNYRNFPRRWFVFEKDGSSGWRWIQRGEFSTHAEAMKFADEMSRTITVTLPRPTDRMPLGPAAWLELREDGGACAHGSLATIGIRKYTMKRVAMALLAHAHGVSTKPSQDHQN